MTFFQKSGSTYLDIFCYDSHHFFKNSGWAYLDNFCFDFFASTTFLKVGCFKIRGNLSSKCHHYSSINHYNIYLYGLQKTI